MSFILSTRARRTYKHQLTNFLQEMAITAHCTILLICVFVLHAVAIQHVHMNKRETMPDKFYPDATKLQKLKDGLIVQQTLAVSNSTYSPVMYDGFIVL